MRTDLHRPSEIIPANYKFVGFEYLPRSGDDLGDSGFIQMERAKIRAHMAHTGGKRAHVDTTGNCQCCGAHCIYSSLFYHTPSNTYVRFGLICTDKMDMDSGDGNLFRKQVGYAREALAGKRKAQALLAQAGISDAWEIYTSDEDTAGKKEQTIIKDIVGRLVQYGNISEKQAAFVRKLLNDIANHTTFQEKRQAAHDAAQAVPTELDGKRVTIQGTILSIRDPDEWARFSSRKMLVQHADGWKVWSTLPRELSTANRGDVIRFNGQLKISDKDPKFCFVSRPSKAELIQAITAVVDAMIDHAANGDAPDRRQN